MQVAARDLRKGKMLSVETSSSTAHVRIEAAAAGVVTATITNVAGR